MNKTLAVAGGLLGHWVSRVAKTSLQRWISMSNCSVTWEGFHTNIFSSLLQSVKWMEFIEIFRIIRIASILKFSVGTSVHPVITTNTVLGGAAVGFKKSTTYKTFGGNLC